MTGAEFLSRLQGVRKSGPGYEARCPVHDDHRQSMTVTFTEDRILAHCHVGCSIDEICTSVDCTPADLFFRTRPQNNGDGIVATYDYVDEDGQLLFQVVRKLGKQFLQRHRGPDGQWVWNIKGVRRVPYRLPQLIAAVASGTSVWVCEGEKDVHALEGAGAVATTNPGGADTGRGTKWRAEYNEYFRDAIVAVVADRDDAGRAHARHVAHQLASVAKSVELCEPAEGKDVSDHLAAGLTLGDLVGLSFDDEAAPSVDASEARPWRVASAVPAEKVDWLWYPRIPLGKLSLEAGDPGVGKGYVAAAIAASVTGPVAIPDGGCLTRGTVLWASFEDAAGDTLRPRLEKQKADLDRVLFLDQWLDEYGRPRTMRPADVPLLDKHLEDLPDARLLVIDPLGSFVGGGIDTHRDNEVRSVLQPLVDLAARHRIAVLTIAHLNKAELLKAIYRIGGSIGFVGLPRSVLAVGKDEQSGRRGLAHGKTNIGPEAVTIEYRIVPGATWDEVATLEWVGVAPDLTTEMLLGSAPKKPGPDPEEREAVKAALAVLLADGPKSAEYCLSYCRAELFAKSTVDRAKKELGVICEQVKGATGRRGSPGWTWRLP